MSLEASLKAMMLLFFAGDPVDSSHNPSKPPESHFLPAIYVNSS